MHKIKKEFYSTYLSNPCVEEIVIVNSVYCH